MIVKLAMVAVALALVVHFGIVSPAAVAATFTRPGPAFVALALIVLGAHLNVLRWHLLLRWQGTPLHVSRTWQISYISYFLGSFLPGAVGGDALRALYVNRECSETRVPAFLTILFDRILGLAALLIVVLALAAALPGEVAGDPVLATLVLASAALVLALTAALPLVSGLNRWLIPRLYRLPFPRIAVAAEQLGATVANALANWRGQPWRVLFCLSIGVLGHSFVAASIVVLSRAMGIHPLSTLELGLAGMLAVLANLLPLTPGGLGVGETSFAQICRLLAPASPALAYGTVIFAFRLVTLLSYLPGAVALLIFRSRGSQAQAAGNVRLMAESTTSAPAPSNVG